MHLIYEFAPTTGLIFFFTFFVWVAFQTLRPSAKKRMEEHARMALKEDGNERA